MELNQSDLNKTFSVECYIKTTNNCSCQIYLDNQYVMNLISVPALNEFGLVSGSFSISRIGVISVRFLYNPNNPVESVLFLDDLNIKIQ